MIHTELLITNKLGLHARASSKLVQLANQFKSQLIISKGNTRANAKSIMTVMMLAASRGSSLSLEANGVDEQMAVDAISNLINDKFGEGE